MIKYFSTIAITLILGVSIIGGNAWGRPDCPGNSCAAGVPELSAATGPVALAIILGIVGIGLERRRRNNKK